MSSNNPTALEVIRDDSIFELEETVRSITAWDEKAQSGASHAIASFCHRRLAMCTLLKDGDADGFFAHLCHSAHARLDFANRAAGSRKVDPMYSCGSKEISFIDAMAAGELDLASKVAQVAARQHHPDLEYEEDFLLHRFLQQLALGLVRPPAREDLGGLLDRWKAVNAGAHDPYLEIGYALLAHDQQSFNDALTRLAKERFDSFNSKPHDEGPNDEFRRTEGALFMNGLALLRLAEMSGLTTDASFPGLPAIARIPTGKTPPAPTGWMAPPTS